MTTHRYQACNPYKFITIFVIFQTLALEHNSTKTTKILKYQKGGEDIRTLRDAASTSGRLKTFTLKQREGLGAGGAEEDERNKESSQWEKEEERRRKKKGGRRRVVGLKESHHQVWRDRSRYPTGKHPITVAMWQSRARSTGVI